MKKKLIILSGAGISAESGIKTFRDADGLWEGHDVMEVASPEGWYRNKELVLNFYNERRKQLLEVEPNSAHVDIAKLEKKYEVVVITQNVDDLHERGGSSKIIHLHGELLKARSTGTPELVYDWIKDLSLEDRCADGYQLRPHIVWFGEQVPKLEEAIIEIENSDIVIIIGTSMQVYPAASLIQYAPNFSKKYYIDPKPAISEDQASALKLQIITKTATEGMKQLLEELL
jgi:NAD-dependent deacetylase